MTSLPPVRLSRRDFLCTLTAAGSVAALGWATLPRLPRLIADLQQPLPEFAFSSPRSVQAYRATLALPALMARLDCYCGCANYEPPHGSLAECFITPAGEFDPHGSACELCQVEAIAARQWADAGVAWSEIRSRIDAEYASHDPSLGCSLGGAAHDTSAAEAGGCQVPP